MSDDSDRDGYYREHARRMVADDLSDDEIGHRIVVTFDEAERPLVWRHVFEFRSSGGKGPGPAAAGAHNRLPRRKGRPPLTEGRVRSDIEEALSQLRQTGESVTLDLLAWAHPGELTRGGLDYRIRLFPQPFRELVPHLIRE